MTTTTIVGGRQKEGEVFIQQQADKAPRILSMLGRVALKTVSRSNYMKNFFAAFLLVAHPNLSTAFVLASAGARQHQRTLITTTTVTTIAAGESQRNKPGTGPPFASSTNRSYHRTVLSMAPKAGVSSPDELKAFVEAAGEKLVVIDVRNPDAAIEPGDQKSLVVAGLPSETNRPQAQHLIWDRETDSMPLPVVDSKDTPIITHCGGGGRGQKAKEFLLKQGFTNVLNGGGPKEKECWAEFGTK